ncbi:hypothetical protein [Haloferula sp.]|uniref:hypothetical protein n=1 Tax=Haloferula sp. TaxID=2497595 RepID=UPI0032A0BE39
MKVYPLPVLLALIGGLGAEEFTDSTPTAFETRNSGQTSESGVSMAKRETKTRKVTYIAVCETRNWKNSEGTVIKAMMLAFDSDPKAPEKQPLQLVSEGKIRLLIDGAKQFNLYPLAKLSGEDQEFVNKLVAARKAEAAAKEEKSKTE